MGRRADRFDGTAYQIAAVVGDEVRRWRFDEAGAEVRRDFLWDAAEVEWLDAFFVADGIPIAITGGLRSSAPGATVRARTGVVSEVDLLPADFDRESATAALAGDVVHLLFSGECTLGGIGVCHSSTVRRPTRSR